MVVVRGPEAGVAPYLWLPWLDMNLGYNLPRGLGGSLPASLSVGPGEIYNNARFGAVFAGEVRYGRFSALTDVLYLNVGFDANRTRLRSVDFFGAPSQAIPPGSVLDTSSVAKTTIWTLAGGYTVLEGGWGNLDVIAGFRLLAVNATTGFDLAATFTGPRGNAGVLTGSGTVSASRDGVGGVRGRIRIPSSYFFVPHYTNGTRL